MTRRVLLAAAILGGACAARPAKTTEVAELRRQLDSLRRQSERDQRTLHSLESRVFLCEDRLETALVAGGRNPDAVPRLPVAKRTRPPERAPEPPLDDEGPIPSVEPDIYSEENVEIVYEGEAARGGQPRRVIRIHESEAEPTPFEDEEIDPATVTDRLPVVPLPEEPPPSDPAPAPHEPAPLDPMTVYQSGYAALQERDHAAAVSSFVSFMQLWPDHDYADNAQYWLGEVYYDRKNYKVALAEFRKVVKNYAHGNKVPDALLKIGFCHAQLADVDAARDVLAQVVQIYPKTDAARLAAKRLEELKR